MNDALLRSIPARPPEVLPPGQKSLSDLATAIREANSAVMTALGNGIEAAIRAGKALTVAKRGCKHGEWEDFVAAQCGIPLRRAQYYMLLARNEVKLFQGLSEVNEVKAGRVSFSQREALKLLRTPRRRRSAKPNAKPPDAKAQ